MVRRFHRGTMLMEAVLAVPLVISLFLACFQFVMLAYARLMTEYAAATAVRVAEVFPQGDAQKKEAIAAARRVLVPVSWSYSIVDVKDTLPGFVADKVPVDTIDLTKFDFPAAARQPLGWFPLWNAGWIEDQVDVEFTLTKADRKIPNILCQVTFKCPLHVPFIADLLVKAGIAKTFSPKGMYGLVETKDVPYMALKGRAVRVLSGAEDLMPEVEERFRIGK